MAWEALTVTHFLAAASMFLLAGWLLSLNFESRVHRGFALFLFLRGMVTILYRFVALLPDGPFRWEAIAGYFHLGTTFALAYFLVVYVRRDGGRRGHLWRGAILLAALVAEAFYVFDHCLLRCTTPEGRVLIGPLALLTFGLTPLYAFAGLVLARESLRAPRPERREAAFLVAAAFLLQAILESSIVVGLAATDLGTSVGMIDAGVWSILAFLGRAVALLPAVYGILLLTSERARAIEPRRLTTHLRVVALLAGATGVYQAIVPFRAPALALTATFLTGAWLVLLPALVTVALVRHRLFDAETQIRWTLSRGPIAFVFLAVFFVGAQIAEGYLSSYGWVGGGIASGVLLFALHPLQRMGERLADGVAPRSTPLSTLSHAERLDLYRAQAALAWSDGVLGRKERFLLDSLRERLGLTHEESSRLEREAIDSTAAA